MNTKLVESLAQVINSLSLKERNLLQENYNYSQVGKNSEAELLKEEK